MHIRRADILAGDREMHSSNRVCNICGKVFDASYSVNWALLSRLFTRLMPFIDVEMDQPTIAIWDLIQSCSKAHACCNIALMHLQLHADHWHTPTFTWVQRVVRLRWPASAKECLHMPIAIVGRRALCEIRFRERCQWQARLRSRVTSALCQQVGTLWWEMSFNEAYDV